MLGANAESQSHIIFYLELLFGLLVVLMPSLEALVCEHSASGSVFSTDFHHRRLSHHSRLAPRDARDLTGLGSSHSCSTRGVQVSLADWTQFVLMDSLSTLEISPALRVGSARVFGALATVAR